MCLKEEITSMGIAARKAALSLAAVPAEQRNRALLEMADAVDSSRPDILAANSADVAAARDNGLKPALIDRLTLTDARLDAVSRGLREVAALPDPLDADLGTVRRPSGIEIKKVPVPIGVIVIIFESRPNVTADAAALCVKSGNAVILRGGKEALNSNKAIAAALAAGAARAGLPENTVQLVGTTDHAAVAELVKMDRYVDVVIPRGGEKLIRAVMENARVPVIKHYNGICHIYVDSAADLDMALSVIRNAKCQRPGTCNAVETILVAESVAATFIPRLADACREWGVAVKADAASRALADGFEVAEESDWTNEYLALKLSLKIVADADAAIAHINRYGSHHSDAVITSDAAVADKFTKLVDSAAVYVNASTRFTDGGEFGMGCEMGISTDKLHARGPVGIRELTTYKYVVHGNGSIRA